MKTVGVYELLGQPSYIQLFEDIFNSFKEIVKWFEISPND